MKIILNNCRITIREIVYDVGISFGTCQAIFTDVLGMKHAAAKIVPKFLNFEQKQWFRFAQKCQNWWRVMGIWLWHWNQNPIINGSVQKSQDRKKHVKFGQMWRFCPLFSSIAMAWCIMNSCHKVVRSIKNTASQLWAETHITVKKSIMDFAPW